ncbi:MAG TPA: acyl-CoA dehydrogenase family protein [Acidimicrobiales bacterium]|nr:acyl-CoA dehydrogenase family protein [Acidimicrobiales bacterium]
MSTTDTLDQADGTTDPVAWADELGRQIAEHAERHDREGSFVTEAYDLLRESGYLALAVPTELGGHGATIRDVAMAQRALAHHCAATALATTMHHHVVLFTAWRYRRELPGAEATLRRVADEGIVILSTGGNDTTRPKGEAVATDGGFLVSGRKSFVSQAPAGAVMSTMFAYDDPEQGRRVLNMAVPVSSEGVRVIETWDALGMRGTGSHDVELQDVFVPEERVLANRPHGKVDGPLQVIFSNAFPPISAVYLGVAEAARDAAVEAVKGTPKADDPIVRRAIGLMDTRLRIAGWALDGAIAAVGDDPQPSMDNVVAVMAAKREIALAGIEVCNLAMDVVGGPAFAKGSVIERCYRDVRGAGLHPFGNEETLVHAGTVALGLPADDR